MTTSTESAWLAFLRTLGGRYRDEPVERLGDAGALDAFLSSYGLRPARRPVLADVVAARELREAMHAVTRAVHEGAVIPPRSARVVSAALAYDEPVRLVRASGTLRVHAVRDVPVALAGLARSMVSDLTGPRAAALRACGDPTCSSFFFDDTGRRQWCGTGTCGTRVRVARHRARIATA